MNSLLPVQKVYLAGGMKSNWQDQAIKAVAKQYFGPIIYLDPRQHGSRQEEVYTSWDLAGVEAADVLFVYLEHDNPGGHGLALEIGFAVGMARAGAKPKHIIFVCEEGHPADRYFGMARACSDEVVTSFDKGIELLVRYLAQRSLPSWPIASGEKVAETLAGH